jgi:hypothetical protein
MKRKQIWSELHKPTQMPSSLGIADSTWNSFQSVPAMLLAAKSGSGHLPVLSRFWGRMFNLARPDRILVNPTLRAFKTVTPAAAL